MLSVWELILRVTVELNSNSNVTIEIISMTKTKDAIN